MSGVIFGTSNIIERYIKHGKDFQSKLTEKEIKLIEQIEKLEIEMLQDGINPDHLSLKDVYEYLDKNNKNNKKQRYDKFKKKIEEQLKDKNKKIN